MPTICLCHAPGDLEFAVELAAYLARGTGAGVFVDEGRMAPGETLASKVLDGRMADIVLAVVSPLSAPAQWRREEWKPAFQSGEDVRVAALLAADCRIPDLMRRGNFIDCTGPRLQAMRAVKRWVLEGCAPVVPPFAAAAPPIAADEREIDRLACVLADVPGKALAPDAPTALHFAVRHGAEFEAVLWADAGGTAAATAGSVGAELGLRLDGELRANVDRLRTVCLKRRFLVVMDGSKADPLGLFNAGGLSSVLSIPQPVQIAPPDLAGDELGLAAAMAACGGACALELAAEAAELEPSRARAAAESLVARGLLVRLDARYDRFRLLFGGCAPGALPRNARAVLYAGDLAATRHVFNCALAAGAWPQAVDLGRRAAALAVREERLAEAFEALDSLHTAAAARRDQSTVEYAAWERAWILERWGRFDEAIPLRRLCGAFTGRQLDLSFG